MTPEQFVEKWSQSALSERAASQEHFIDLCGLLGQPTPGSDATGEDYCFEKHVKVVAAASAGSKGEYGFVDVWKRDRFGWEYKQKGKYKTLQEAFRQLYQYRDDLQNPPLSVVCDIRTIEIRTHFRGYPSKTTTIRLEEIPGKLGTLRAVFTDPEFFIRTEKRTDTITNELADEFGVLAGKLIDRYPPGDLQLWDSIGSPVAHFLMKVMFCLFAEDVGLLPNQTFTKIIELCLRNPDRFEPLANQLFSLMRKGGEFGVDVIPYFNGGLFDDAPALPLNHPDLVVLRKVAGDGQNWAGVEPSIFGTLFERILDPKKRAQIGAHYTSKDDILLVVEPVIMAPLRRRWQAVQDELKDAIARHDKEPNRAKRDTLAAPIKTAVEDFRQYLGRQRVLDPACGSGNFLYVALQQLLDLEDEVVRFCARRDIGVDATPRVRPTQLHGIEINPYAAELAQVVIWIGYLQWLHVHGIDDAKRPILDKLQTIEHRDALLTFETIEVRDYTEDEFRRAEKQGKKLVTRKTIAKPAEWPAADFIVGNPPFLGSKLFRKQGLKNDYLLSLWSAFDIPRASDLCCYWFERGRQELARTPSLRVGLLATQGIRGGDNREVLRRIKSVGDIFLAWADHEWVLDGAAVNVSIIGFDAKNEQRRTLDGRPVAEISPNLRGDIDTTVAKALVENCKIGFMGDTKGGPFDVEYGIARKLLAEPNPNGKPTADVVRPWANGLDVTRRDRGTFIVDFGVKTPHSVSAQYEAAFDLVATLVKADRANTRQEKESNEWWLHVRPRPDMRKALAPYKRFVVTPNLTKYRLFRFFDSASLPDHQLIAFARSDDFFLGVLHAALHELWALRLGTQLEDRPRYTPTTCFETFPLPWPPGKEDTAHPAYARIAAAAKALDEQRERWLNPPEWIEPLAARVDAADDFADVPADARPLIRRSAIMAAAAKDARLKKRTLTNLYNERPTWLKLAHESLDRAVLAAYAAVDPAGGWTEDWAAVWVDTGAGQPLPADHPLAAMRTETDQRVLANLLRLNHARAAGDAAPGPTAV